MATLFNNTEITNAFFNGTELDKIYFNGVLVFEKNGKYLRRIMVGDNLKGKILYGNFLSNLQDYIYINPDVPAETRYDIKFISSSQTVAIIDFGFDNHYFIESTQIDFEDGGFTLWYNGESSLPKTISNNKDYIVESISDNPVYRCFFIEDENIRPFEVGDIIGPGTLFYFVFPDDFYKVQSTIPSTHQLIIFGPSISKEDNEGDDTYIDIRGRTQGIDHWNEISLSTMNMTTGENPTIDYFYRSLGSDLRTNLSSYTLSLEKLYKINQVSSSEQFKEYSKYALVDTKTLYRNIKIGDNLKDKILYFTFPDDMYLDMKDEYDIIKANDDFTINSSSFSSGGDLIAYLSLTWNTSKITWSKDNVTWKDTPGVQPYTSPDYSSQNWTKIYLRCETDLIVDEINEDSIIYQYVYIKEK